MRPGGCARPRCKQGCAAGTARCLPHGALPLASPPPMPPVPRQVPLFAAEPPQEPLPYGRWAEALGERFAAAADTDIGAISWFPDRTFAERTYVPATAPT